MTSGFYRSFDILAGLSYDGASHHQFGYPMSGSSETPGIYDIRGLASVDGNRSKIYATTRDPGLGNSTVYLSTDSGATWVTRSLQPGRPSSGNVAGSNRLACRATNQVWLSTRDDNSLTGRNDGVWRSTDDAATWTRILACEGTEIVYGATTLTGPRGCHTMALGTNVIWFCWQVSGQHVTNLYPSTPPPAYSLYRIEQAPLDGSSRITVTEITLNAESTFSTNADNQALPLRPWGDAFALIPKSSQDILWRVDSTSGAVVIPHSGGRVLDAVPLSATIWLMLNDETLSVGSTSVAIYRSIDAGSTWGLIRHLVGHEAATTVSGAGIQADATEAWQIAAMPGTTEVFVVGGMGSWGPGGSGIEQTAPLYTWYSSDLGASWTAIEDESTPVDSTGTQWMLGNTVGICPGLAAAAVAVPSRLATIVG